MLIFSPRMSSSFGWLGLLPSFRNTILALLKKNRSFWRTKPFTCRLSRLWSSLMSSGSSSVLFRSYSSSSYCSWPSRASYSLILADPKIWVRVLVRSVMLIPKGLEGLFWESGDSYFLRSTLSAVLCLSISSSLDLSISRSRLVSDPTYVNFLLLF